MVNKKKGEELISLEEFRRTADLARISFTPEKEEKLKSELNGVLNYVKELSQVTEKVDNFEKIDHYNLEENVLREDKVMEASDEEKERIRGLFPRMENDQLVVEADLKS